MPAGVGFRFQTPTSEADAEGAGEAGEGGGGVHAPPHACAAQLERTHPAEGARGDDEKRDGPHRHVTAGTALAACALASGA